MKKYKNLTVPPSEKAILSSTEGRSEKSDPQPVKEVEKCTNEYCENGNVQIGDGIWQKCNVCGGNNEPKSYILGLNNKKYPIAKPINNNGLKRYIIELVLNLAIPDDDCMLSDFLHALQYGINKHSQFATEAGGDVTTKLSEIFNNAKEGDDIGIMAYNLGALDTITKAVDILETFRVTALKTKSHSGDFAENLFYQAIEEISGVAPDNVTPKNLVDVEEVIKVINDWWYASNPNKKDIIINNIRNINKR